MSKIAYRYRFSRKVAASDVEVALVLACLAAEILHGTERGQSHANHYFNLTERSCVIDAAMPEGNDLNRLFIGFLRREIADEDFRVERVEALVPPVSSANWALA